MHNTVPSKIYHFTRTRIKHFPLHFSFYHSIYSHEIKQSYYLQYFDSNWEFWNKKNIYIYIRWYDMFCLWWELETTFSFSVSSNFGFKSWLIKSWKQNCAKEGLILADGNSRVWCDNLKSQYVTFFQILQTHHIARLFLCIEENRNVIVFITVYAISTVKHSFFIRISFVRDK